MADEPFTRLPLRGDAGGATGAQPRRCPGNARHQPGQGRRRQPNTATQRAAPVRSWAELEAVAAALGPRYGPMILFAAATGLRPAESVALEKRDIDRDERVVYGRRSYTRRELRRSIAPPREQRPRQAAWTAVEA